MRTQLSSKYPWKSSCEQLGLGNPRLRTPVLKQQIFHIIFSLLTNGFMGQKMAFQARFGLRAVVWKPLC